ncbi:MAG: HAMP domain-containing histidine kinase [Opitutaceae bacterium]|nr:HAMP domain-containing histidine kinase [Opitutaceae bacterium]
MQNSFTRRLTLRVVLLVTLTTVLVLAASVLLLRRQSLKTIALLQNAEGLELLHLLDAPPAPDLSEIKHRFENDADADIALFFIQVRDARGAVLYRSANLGQAFIPAAPAGQRQWTTALNKNTDIRVSEFDTAGGLRLQVASDLSRARHILRSHTRVGLVLTAASALFGIFAGVAFSRMTVAPIRAIESAARRISADNLGERIPVPPGNDELTALASLLNHTFDHLETAFSQVRRFTADASHELKTPLTLVRLSAEKLRPRLADDPEADAMLADILEETGRMSQLIESLLFIARAEGGAFTLERKPHEMSAFIADFLEDARALAGDRGLRSRAVENASGSALIDPRSLRQLLLNLVSNAIAASPPGGCITLESSRTATGWRLAVTDEGPGLPPGMLGRVFERFTRHAPVPENPGQGLGLAICWSIAELHGGKIRAENRPGRPGLSVIMEW